MPVAKRVSFMPIPISTSCSAAASKDRPGCIYVLNNLGDKWSGTSVKTKWANQKFKPVAWDGHDTPIRTNEPPTRKATPSSLPRRADMRSMLRSSVKGRTNRPRI